jgi:hypothetical protein
LSQVRSYKTLFKSSSTKVHMALFNTLFKSKVRPHRTLFNKLFKSKVRPYRTQLNKFFKSKVRPYMTLFNKLCKSQVRSYMTLFNKAFKSRVRPYMTLIKKLFNFEVRPYMTLLNKLVKSKVRPSSTRFASPSPLQQALQVQGDATYRELVFQVDLDQLSKDWGYSSTPADEIRSSSKFPKEGGGGRHPLPADLKPALSHFDQLALEYILSWWGLIAYCIPGLDTRHTNQTIKPMQNVLVCKIREI